MKQHDEATLQELKAQGQWIVDVVSRASGVRILSTLPFRKIRFWNDVVETCEPRKNWLTPLTSVIGIPDALLIVRLLLRARKYQLVLLTGGERSDLVYAAIAGLFCPWITTPHVIVDAHWQKSEGIAFLLQKFLLKASSRLVRQVQPHSEEEIDIYSAMFGIPREKLVAIPWSTSMTGHTVPDVEPGEDGGFVVTGGHSFRDYGPFLSGVGELGVPVKIGISSHWVDGHMREALEQFANLQLFTGWSNHEYIEQMSQCRLFAMPIREGLTRATADQTILNAMLLGRIVVASNSIGPRIYIENGRNGFLVAGNSAAEWKEAVRKVFALSSAERGKIGREAAKDAAILFNEEIRLARTLDAGLHAREPGGVTGGGWLNVPRASPPT